MAKRLTNLRIREVSSVDRGAGVGVKVALMKRDGDEFSGEPYWKRDFSDKERKTLAASGKALPDGSFPIENEEDLHNAIQAIGRAKDPAKAKAHIRTRAAAMGATGALPDSWGKRDDMDRASAALRKSMDSIIKDDTLDDEDRLDAVAETFSQYNEFIKSVVADDGAASTHVAKGEDTMSDEMKKKIEDLTAAVAKLTSEAAIAKMSDKHKAFMDAKNMSDEQKGKFAAMEPDERDDWMSKNPVDEKGGEAKAGDKGDDGAKKSFKLPAEIVAKLAENEDLKKRLAVIEEREARSEFAKKAAALGMPEAFGETLRKIDKAALPEVEKAFKGLTAQVDTSTLFKEFGSAGAGTGDAYETLTAKAAELRKADPKLTQEQAFSKVYSDPANKDLVALEKKNPRLRAA